MRRVSLILITVLLANCAERRMEKERTRWLAAFGATAPPGTMALNDSLYYDREEVANFEWLEYQFWVGRTFGTTSSEYLATMPDTSVWYRTEPPHPSYDLDYLRHPAYRNYPVVGLTYEQAMAYCKWRSDRVMEAYLSYSGIVPWRARQTAQDHFTIERFYVTDSLKAYHHLPYPSYDLPTCSEWRDAVAHSDRIAEAGLERCKLRMSLFRSAKRAYCDELIKEGRFVINDKEESADRPMEPIVRSSCFQCEENLLWHLRGNVTELCKDRALVLGGAWTDPRDSIQLDKPFPNIAPNATIGFRNVCRWRKWDGTRE